MATFSDFYVFLKVKHIEMCPIDLFLSSKKTQVDFSS